MTVVLTVLALQGVDTVFAYPGGASMEIHQALTRSETISNILCRHEQVRQAASAQSLSILQFISPEDESVTEHSLGGF